MKAVELKEMTIEELRVREDELAEELARMRIQLAVKRLDNPLKVRVTRRELARVKTVINEKIKKAETDSGGISESEASAEDETR